MGIGNRAARTLLYEEVVKDLYQMIDDEHLKPGDKMPPERELMEQLDVRDRKSTRLNSSH